MPIQWTPASPWSQGISADSVLQELSNLNLEEACEIYRVSHRSVFKTSLPPLGEVAVKEVRHLRAKQRFKLREGGQSKAEREFHNTQAAFQKGIRTPVPYALGLDRSWLGMKRVYQIYEWLPNADTLTDRIFRGERPWRELSDFLWSCAQAGLVHGGHSSENLLRCEGQWYVIDLADARLEDRYERTGFVRDVARIARKLIRLKALKEREVAPMIEEIVLSSRDASLRNDIPEAMRSLVEESRKGSTAAPAVSASLSS